MCKIRKQIAANIYKPCLMERRCWFATKRGSCNFNNKSVDGHVLPNRQSNNKGAPPNLACLTLSKIIIWKDLWMWLKHDSFFIQGLCSFPTNKTNKNVTVAQHINNSTKKGRSFTGARGARANIRSCPRAF